MFRRVAFFGATGGCANSCLANTLRSGHLAIVLVRKPNALREQLQAREISNDIVDRQLSIVEGDVRDLDAVKEVIAWGGKGVDTVVSGIGGKPTPQLNPLRPLTTTEPSICHAATRNIVFAVQELSASALLVVISASGVLNDPPRDYPMSLTPLYRYLLRGIYDDKRAMEMILENEVLPGGHVIVRPSVLNDGAAKGLQAVRQGTTERPVQGYNICRDDVGMWIYERVIGVGDRSSYINRGVQLTY